MSVKKILVILISVALLIGMTPVGAHATMGSASSADATRGFVDMPNDWSTPALQHAVDNGLLLGANGKLNPKGNLTRAEMATIIARVFNAQTKADISHFSDVNPGEWYSEYVAKAYQMQILKGSNGKMLPKSTISRQEAFVIIARALKLAPADQLDKSFSDTNQIANWAKNELFALVNAGYVAGSNGKLNPTGNITRAEFAQVMRNVIEHYIKDPGVISKDYSGNVMINVSDVVLTRSIIKGDLIIGDGVGNGDVTLDGVTITGRLLVRGGGIDSIHIIGGTHVGSLVISRVDGDVRVFVEDGTEIEVVIIEDGSDDVFLEGKFGTVTVVADNIMVDATKAKIANQVINGSNSQILIGDGPVNSGGNSGGVVIPPTVFVPVNEIFLNKADITLFTNIYTNDEELLAVSYNPSNATNKNTSWLSSNPEVATVTQNGVVRAVAVGEATITATSESGGKTATCIVTVLELGTKEGFLEDLNDTVESINVENISIFFDTETESFEVVFENENIDIDMVKVAANSVIESLKDYAGEDSKLTLTNSTGLFFKEFTLKDVSITEIAEFLLGVGGVSDFINNGRVDVTYNASVNYKHATINLEGSLVFRIKGSEEQFLTELSQKIDSVVNAALDDNDEKFVEAKMAEQDISILFANGVDIESVKTTAYNLVTSIKEIVSAGELIINGNTYDLYDELDLTQVAKDLLDGVSLSDFLEGNAVSKEYILNVVYREAHLSIEGNLYFGMLSFELLYYEQNISDDGYILLNSEKVLAKFNSTTNVEPNEIEGFTVKAFNQELIASDGSTVLKLYYDRNTFTVSFNENGGSNVTDITNVRYGTTVSEPSEPTKTGYSFGGWYKEAGLNNTWNFTEDTVNSATTLYAKWNPNTNTAYKVEHYQQAVSGTGYTLVDTENLIGTTEASVTAAAKTYTGFTENTNHENRVASGIIVGDGSTVLKLYYDRNTFTVSFDEKGGSSVADIANVRYGASISSPGVPTKTGYSFGGWYKEAGLTNAWEFNIDTVVATTTLYAKWNPNTNTAYKVEHYQQAVSGTGYTLVDTENLTGTTESSVTAAAKEYTGFTENTTHADRLASGEVAADGSTILKLYYDRNTFTVSFTENGGSSVADITNVRYGASIASPNAPTKTGYSFGGWYKEAGLTNAWDFTTDAVVATTTLYAKWNPNTNTAYKVEHYQQAVSGETYVLKDTEQLVGTTEASVTAAAKEYTGFNENLIHADRLATEEIAADGTLVLKLYYDRNTFTVSFTENGGSSVADIINVRYGASISSPSVPTKTGYSFGGWYKEAGLNNTWNFTEDTVNSATTLYAKWNPNTNTAYKVEHYQQAVSGETYVLKDTENLTGTTEASVTAAAKTYTGFTENTTHADRLASGEVAADGSTVLKLYYDRNTFTVSFSVDGGSSVADITNVRYGATTAAPSEPTKTGYSFGGWYKEAGLTNTWDFTTDAVVATTTLYAKWNPNTNTAYKVEHYQQAVSGETYVLKDTENLTGTTDASVTAAAKTYTGFTENTTHESRVASGEIVGDGSTVLKLYYDRDTFTVTFKNHDNSVLKTESVRYGGSATAPTPPERNGFEFTGWNGSFNNVTADVDVTAQYEPILRIGHEKIDGINYVNYSYTNNTVKTDTIRLPIYSGVTDVTSDYNITYYDKENGTAITSFNLADGGTTLKVYVVASSSQYEDYNGYVVFKYGSVTIGKNENYLTIEDALSKSKSGDIIYVKYNTKFAAADVGTFTYGYSESTPYVIKTGVTLLLPYDNTLETKIDKGVNNTTAINRNQFYVSLTLPEDIKLAVNGTLTVNALRGNASTKYMGIINSFNYSKLNLEQNSEVQVASNGSLNAIGFISGAGSIEALNGSTVVEAAFVKQFRGGTDTSSMPGTAFPFDQYTVANIEVPIKINAGSVYNASIMIYMSNSWYPSTLLIASNKTGKDQPLIKMDEGYALKTYDSINGNVKLELHGVASVNSTSVKIGSFSTNTSGKSLSFDGTWHIAVKENSNLSINTQIALLPGATMVVEDSATLTVASGGRLTVFNPYEYVVESSGYSDYPISSASYYRIAPNFNFTSTSPAVLSVAGSLVIENGGGVAGEINLVEGGQLTKNENTVDSYDYYYVTGSTKALVQKRTVQFLSSEAVNEIILVSDKYSGAIATTMNLKAIVRNGLGEPLNGIAVTFSNSKGTWSATGTTNSSGVATASATYSAAAKETGKINVEINNSNVKAEINYDYNGAYSCPLVYSYDGDVFNLEHEPVSYSVNRAFEDTTYGTLRKLQPVNDQYQIRITEEMDSQTFANGFSLYTVDYLETNEVKGIMADIFGNPHTIKERLAPKSFVDSAGNSWLREATTEGLIVTSSSDLLTQGQFVESYEAAFSRPEETSQIAKLMFHVKATEIVDMYGKWFTDLIDAENNLWWVEKLIEHPDIFEQFVYGVNAVTFVVELWNGNEWIVQGEIGAGSHLLEEFLVPLDLNLISDEADEIKVRLSGGAGFFEISQVSIDFSENRNMYIKRLDINSALKNGTEEVSTIIDDFSDNQRVKLVKGDYIDLYYEVPELLTGYNRGFIVAFKGYFHGAPYTVENTIVDIWGDMDFDDLVASILEEQPEAVEIMPNFMWLSELFRSVYTSTLEEKINKIIVEQVLR